MGCSMEQGYYCGSDEKPVHVVHIEQPFYMMQHEVTQELYQSIIRKVRVISPSAEVHVLSKIFPFVKQ